jgi:hypothetical protein
MPRQSPDKTPDRDEAHSDKGFFERVAAWLDANELDYAEYPDGQFFARAIPATPATGGSSSMSPRASGDAVC